MCWIPVIERYATYVRLLEYAHLRFSHLVVFDLIVSAWVNSFWKG